MNTRLLEFSKSNHFIYNQWNRSIDDHLLYQVLPFVECTNCEKDIVFVLPSFLIRKGLGKDDKHCLVLVIKRKLLITGYWCDHPNYLFNKKDKAHFQIVY